MKELFKFNQQPIRVFINEKGDPEFCAIDITMILGYKNGRKAEFDHCKLDGVTKRYATDTTGRDQLLTHLNEGNLFRLIVKSTLPEAERFEKFVFEEVLPSIRKHGMYATESVIAKALNNPDFIIDVLQELKRERAAKQALQAQSENQAKELKEAEPKILFADCIAISDDSILIAALAKLMKQKGIDTGQNRLFTWMRKNGYLCVKGEYYNQPTQRAMEMGLFEIKTSTGTTPDGVTHVSKTPKVTGKGQIYFIKKFL